MILLSLPAVLVRLMELHPVMILQLPNLQHFLLKTCDPWVSRSPWFVAPDMKTISVASLPCRLATIGVLHHNEE
jgi:hypothetical protein